MYVKKLSGRTHDGQSHSNAERVRNISMWKKCAHVQVKFNCKETKPKHLYFYLMWCLYQLFLLFCGMPTFHLRCCEELIIWRWVSTLYFQSQNVHAMSMTAFVYYKKLCETELYSCGIPHTQSVRKLMKIQDQNNVLNSGDQKGKEICSSVLIVVQLILLRGIQAAIHELPARWSTWVITPA